jgi:hypothetical protein
VIGASYTDAGTATAPALLGDAVTLLNPRDLQAEHAERHERRHRRSSTTRRRTACAR